MIDMEASKQFKLKKDEQKRIQKVKHECHVLMELIWKKDKIKNAYIWLHKNVQSMHFSSTNDYAILFRARKALQKEAMDRGLLTIEELNYVVR